MPQKKGNTSKKRRKKQKKMNSAESFENGDTNQYDDNIQLYERENVDLLDSIDGINYDEDKFNHDFPHIAQELGDPELIYPMDAVRWENKDQIEEDFEPPEEPTVESLLRRSKTKEEALEIIKYLEKRGEISSREAKKLIVILNSKGLKAFK
ncbi:MAG: DUF2095 family protein [Promethearchaeota archaeon]